MYYINSFFIYSFFGYIYECIYNKIKNNENGSGILYGPYTPIYGIGSVIILLVSKYIFSLLKLPKILEILIMLISITIILTFLEWLGGTLIEKIFKVTFWNYRRFKYNIGKYIALEVSIIWVLGALLIIYVIQPFLDKFIYLIPNYITYLLILGMLIDFTIVFVKKKVHK